MDCGNGVSISLRRITNTKGGNREMSLEDKAKKHASDCAVIAAFFGSCDQRTFNVVKRGSESSYREGYKQAIDDLMERVQSVTCYAACCECYMTDDFFTLESLKQIAEDLKR